jgi:putative endonuclease
LGVTSHLVQRVWQHKNEFAPSFTKDYHVHFLVYYELHDSMEQAILREKQLKKWKRAWKLALIEKENPSWHDLYPSIL